MSSRPSLSDLDQETLERVLAVLDAIIEPPQVRGVQDVCTEEGRAGLLRRLGEWDLVTRIRSALTSKARGKEPRGLAALIGPGKNGG